MMETPPTVFIVDDNKGMRRSLHWLLESVGLPCLAFESAEEFLEAGVEHRPGCLVLDIRMPGMGGLELQARLEQTGVRMPVIIVTAHGDVPTAVRAMKTGAVDFLEKPFSDQLLLERIHHCLRLDAERRQKGGKADDVQARMATLTKREREVLDLVAEGLTTKETARRLEISPKTVEVYRSKLLRKMAANSVVELVNLVHMARGTGD